ncbi:MAG: ATP-binding protein [Methanobrevibacter sp.]|nr:ATP-binding protein [Methanobrevibacter sp.]
MKTLPVGTQTFSIIRENDYLYVDKTKYILKMINDGRINFLSRPRRFGKSLLVSTIEELYKGSEKLFEGLDIHKKRNWNEKYPVIKLDLSGVKNVSSTELEYRLIEIIYNIGKDFGVELKSKTSQGMFDSLILQVYRLFNKRIVVLIDEYDAPLNDNLENLKVFENNRDILQSLYTLLKTRDEYLQFIFITGVSKIGSTSIFSKLNSPSDLTLVKDYSKICGYTHKEVEKYLHLHIESVAKKENVAYDEMMDKINYWYDGYSWDGQTRLFNPYSIMSMLKDKDFTEYWFSTGTTTFLMNRIKENNDLKPILKPTLQYKEDLLNFDINNNIIALLFQTGYLTIKEIKKDFDGDDEYYLYFPNREVKNAFGKHLLNSYSNYSNGELNPLKKKIMKEIYNLDSEGLTKSFEFLLSRIPYQLHMKNESYYHSLILSWLRAYGFDIKSEDPTSDGRIDAILERKDPIVITEFKYSYDKEDENGKVVLAKSIEKLLDDAFTQIHEKKYYKKYYNKDKIIILGVAISNKEIGVKFELFD